MSLELGSLVEVVIFARVFFLASINSITLHIFIVDHSNDNNPFQFSELLVLYQFNELNKLFQIIKYIPNYLSLI